MADQNPRTSIGVFVLAGSGAGAVAGLLVGLLARQRSHAQAQEELSETVDELKRRAEMILTQLSRSETPSPGDPAQEQQTRRSQLEPHDEQPYPQRNDLHS